MIMPPFATILPLIYRWAAILAIGAALFGLGWLQGAHHEQLKAVKFEAATEALGKAQIARNRETEARQNANLKEIKNGLKSKLKLAGDNAVANYVARYGGVCNANPPGREVSKPAAGVGGDAATSQRIVVADGAFIRDCASDAAVLDTWQQWAVKNRIPVKD